MFPGILSQEENTGILVLAATATAHACFISTHISGKLLDGHRKFIWQNTFPTQSFKSRSPDKVTCVLNCKTKKTQLDITFKRKLEHLSAMLANIDFEAVRAVTYLSHE
jgi:hypothetical protein